MLFPAEGDPPGLLFEFSYRLGPQLEGEASLSFELHDHSLERVGVADADDLIIVLYILERLNTRGGLANASSTP